ncbi:MAG: ABC transporter permease [Ignavibacteria bacterium]|nr:ABC transporter permease [Ignavibacteria bacterium]
MNEILTLAFVVQVSRMTIPYLLPSLGAVFSEKGGVINIALEGIMLSGAFAAVAVIHYTSNLFLGIIAAAFSGLLISAVHSFITIIARANQIVSGIALNILALGITKYLCKVIFGSSSNSERIPGTEVLNLGFDVFIPFSVIILFLAWIIIYKTKFGLRLRACGENPEAADSLGVNVFRIRFSGILISGLLASLGGAYLALEQHSFTDGMTAGRGYIALAAMITGKWNPLGAATACMFFGLMESFSLQFSGSEIPNQFIQMIPYVITIIVLAGFIGKARPPKADGIAFEKN